MDQSNGRLKTCTNSECSRNENFKRDEWKLNKRQNKKWMYLQKNKGCFNLGQKVELNKMRKIE